MKTRLGALVLMCPILIGVFIKVCEFFRSWGGNRYDFFVSIINWLIDEFVLILVDCDNSFQVGILVFGSCFLPLACWFLLRYFLHISPPRAIAMYCIPLVMLMRNPWQPNTINISNNRFLWAKNITSVVRNFSHTNVNCTWSSHWHHHVTRLFLLTTPRIIDLSLKLDSGQLCKCLEL